MPKQIPAHEIAEIIELRGVFDGWSVARLKDGTLVNRWERSAGGMEARRWRAAQDYIDAQSEVNTHA